MAAAETEVDVSVKEDGATAEDVVEAEEGEAEEGEAEEEKVVVDIASLPKFHISVLAHITPCQLQNGLRHNNYLRYRRNLRRLRKTLKFNYSRDGKKFQKNSISSDFTDERFPYIPLMNSERAWAYAMQLKQDSAQDEENSRLRLRMIRRLKKASQWSQKFLRLCQDRGDDRTQLEAAARNDWLEALVSLEYEMWGEALKKFIQSEQIYRQLQQLGDSVEQSLFEKKASEISSQIELIQYKIDLSAGKGSAKRMIELMSKMSSATSQVLQTKLDAMLLEKRKRDASTMRSVHFRGNSVDVKEETIRVKFLEAQDLLVQLSACDNKSRKEEILYEFNGCCDSALQLLNKIISRAGGLKSGNVKAEATVLTSYIVDLKLQQTLIRNAAMTEEYIQHYHEDSESKQQRVRPEEIIRLHETLLQNVTGLLNLKGGRAEDSGQKVLELYEKAFSARRCLYLADSFEKADKMAEALALLNHAAKVSQTADEQINVELIDIKDLKAKIDIAKCRTAAKVVLGQTGTQQTQTSQNRFLLKRQDRFVQTSKSDSSPFMIAEVPVAMEPTPCTPEVFDIVKKNIPAPNLDHRVSVKKVDKKPPASTPAPALMPATSATSAPAPAPAAPKANAGWFGSWWS